MDATERVTRCLRGEKTDLIPFTTYGVFLRHCQDVESLIKRGMGVIHPVSSVKIWMENVDIRETEYMENERKYIRTVYSTPVGEVSTLKEVHYHSDWLKEFMLKTPDDYKVIKYMLSHRRYKEDYDSVCRMKAQLGSECILRDSLPLEPLQYLIVWDVMDITTFATEWYDNRDEIMDLYRINADFHRQMYGTFAESPLMFANYGGNVIPSIIGREVFRDMYVPYYNEAADIFHKRGKLLGTHLDADNTPIMDLIGGLRLDYIEAYDPSVGPSLQVAKEKFKDKAISINWPSGEHFRSPGEISEITRALADVYGSQGGLLMAITEDLPKGRWDEIMHAILDGLGYKKM